MRPNFRAWLKPEQRMVDVYEMTFMDDKITIISTDMNFYINDEFELMQSTGLKDKHGKEIYEGDIVKYNLGRNIFTDIVDYDKDFAGFGVRDADADTIFTFGELWADIELRSLEVVGNKYEHPELLRGE